MIRRLSNTVHSFLMIGQSNMAGRGFLNDVVPIHDEGIKMLRNGRWQVMAEPINYDRPFSGVGPAASFAQAWRKLNPDEEIGLIPCADGGSSLNEWMPGGALFDHAIMQAKLAQRISKIDGILWHQGETDCPDECVAVYEDKLEHILAALRAELSLHSIPLLIGGLGDYLPDCAAHDYYSNAPRLTEHLKHFAVTHENCYFVTAAKLSCNPDMLHFNARSQRIFGFRYFIAFAERRSVMEPLNNEAEVLERGNNCICQSTEEKITALKKQLETGRITKQEYDLRIDKLISTM